MQGLKTPTLHERMSGWLDERWQAGERELLLMAFRGAGKSTLVGLFAAWLLADDPGRRILVLSADHALARRMVRNVKRLIERHPATQGLKPARLDEWASDRFTVNREVEYRDPSMLAKGIGANITGCRADVVICDDVEVPNTCDTAAKREDLRDRLDEIDYVLVPGGLTLFIGTPHTLDSLYLEGTESEDETGPYLAGYARLEFPLLDDTGASRWPERFPAEKIERLRRRSGPSKFQSQMMLRPASLSDGRLDPARLVPYDAELDYREGGGEAVLRLGEKRLISASCWWDPAYGAPERGDGSVIACIFTDEDGNLRLHAVEYITFDPLMLDHTDELTQQCDKALSFADRHVLPGIRVETNGIGKMVPGTLRRMARDRGLGLRITDEASRTPKALRILDAFDAALAANRLYAHADVLASPLIEEMRNWRPGADMPDDGLDAVAGCLRMEPLRLPAVTPEARPKPRRDWRQGVRPRAAKTEFDI